MAVVAAIISYQHAYELVRSHGESGVTARLLPFTVDGLIWAASMVDWTPAAGTSRYHVWPRGAWALGSWPRSAPTWRMASGTARSAHWSAPGPLALVGSFELRMTLIRTGRSIRTGGADGEPLCRAALTAAQKAPPELTVAPTLVQNVRARHESGQSQRAIAREFNIDRRKVKRILDQAA